MISRPRRDPFSAGSGRMGLFLTGMAVTALFLLLYPLKLRLLVALDHKLYDSLLTSAPLQKTTGLAVVVDIDEKSLKRFGQWPWPRYRIAQLTERLFRCGALAVSFDMVFAEPDRTSLSRLSKEMARDLDVGVHFQKVPENFKDNDRILAAALSKGRSVLGFSFSFNEGKTKIQCLEEKLKIPVLRQPGVAEKQALFTQASSAVCNIPVLAQAASAQGFLNIRPDVDGILRRAPLIVEQGGSIFPSLAVATLMAAGKAETVLVKVETTGIVSLLIDGVTVPLDERENVLIRFRGPSRNIPYFSAADILIGNVSEAIQDRIIFIGTTAAGLKDIHATPYDPVFPGVEVHAHILNNLLSGDFIRRPSWATGLEAMLLITFGTITSAVLVWVGPLLCAGVLTAGTVGLWIGAAWCLGSHGIYLSPLFPFLALIADFTLLSLLKYYRENKRFHAKTRELSLVQEVTLETVANVAETRDPETGGHIKRTQHYVRSLAKHLKHRPKFKHILTDSTIELLFRSAPLHDLGKVGVPDNILLKPDRLTENEFELMKLHTTYAYKIITAAEQRLGNSSFLRLAGELAYSHQEKWDGSGYPQGLKGEEIPFSGRLMAIADVYDALISRRPYKKPMTHEEAVECITAGRGAHFDPELVDAFLEIEEQFQDIARRFADSVEKKEAKP